MIEFGILSLIDRAVWRRDKPALLAMGAIVPLTMDVRRKGGLEMSRSDFLRGLRAPWRARRLHL